MENAIPPPKKFANFNVYYSAFAANLCAMAATCIMSWSSPTLPLITKPGEKIYVTIDEGAWISSIPALGASIGPFVTGSIVDFFGRKHTLLVILLCFTATWTVIYFSVSVPIILCARFVGGLGVGCVYATLPMFLAEIAPVKLRGTLGSLIQLFDCFAYLIEYIVGSFVSYEVLITVSGILPLICFLLFLRVPESPYHLCHKGKESNAIQVLFYYRGHSDRSKLQNDIHEIKASAENIQNNKRTFSELFKIRGTLKQIYFSVALIIIQQGSGINIITFYSKTIFEESGSNLSPNLCSVIVAAVMTFAAVLISPAAKFFNRRTLLTFSSFGITISMFVIGTYFYFKDNMHAEIGSFRWIPVTGLVVFIFTYTLGYGPLVWVIVSEIFPSHLKAAGCAFAASFMWLLAFLLTRFFLPFTESYGKASAFWSFGFVGVISLFFVRFQLPETKGKTFQEIQELIHVCTFPYIIAFPTDSMEIHLIINGNLVQTMSMPKLTLISSKSDIYFAITAPDFFRSEMEKLQLDQNV